MSLSKMLLATIITNITVWAYRPSTTFNNYFKFFIFERSGCVKYSSVCGAILVF